MKKNKKLAFIILITAISFYTVIKVSKFIAIDKCLDKGGSWNYDLDKCECS